MFYIINGSPLSPAVSAETLQKALELMGRQIKNLEKDLETFPPPQSDKDLFVEKMSISSSFSHIFNRIIQQLPKTAIALARKIQTIDIVIIKSFLCLVKTQRSCFYVP